MKKMQSTLSKTAEIELARHTLRNAREIIYWLDEKSNFIFVNDTFCNKLGFKRKEILKRQPIDFFPEFDAEDYKKQWKQLRQGKDVNRETLMSGKSGFPFPVEMNATLISNNGAQYYCAIIRDIAKRKKLEIQQDLRLEQIEKLREQLEGDNALLKEEIELKYDHTRIVTQSELYKNVLAMAEQVAPTEATVLITGETGTGKELIANMIHRLSKRSKRPFVKVNCAALSPTIIESELFGHEKGAFTGATQQKKGRFELAHNSSLFLDEVGELSLPLQAKLLRVLQDGSFERLGGEKTVKVNVRLIAATNRNLEKLVNERKFREDLFYRLNVFPLHNIPLRERQGDIPLLIKHFINKYSKRMGKNIKSIPQNVIDQLFKYEFPGNIRELENIVERALILSTGKKLRLGAAFSLQNKKRKRKGQGRFKSLEEVQKEHILKALKRTKWKVSGKDGAAVLLDIHPKTLWSRMKKLGIEKKST